VSAASEAADAHVRVDALSFVRAESDTYFDSLLAAAGGLGRWHHIREPAPVDKLAPRGSRSLSAPSSIRPIPRT
jgi:hypothetical protein